MDLALAFLSFVTLAGGAVDIFVLKNGGPKPAPRLALFAKHAVVSALAIWVLYFRVFDLAPTEWADSAFLRATLRIGIPVLLYAAMTDAIGFTAWVTKHGSD